MNTKLLDLQNALHAELAEARRKEMSDSRWYTNGGKAASDRQIAYLKEQIRKVQEDE